MADSEFNIKVGVKVDASGIQKQLNSIKGNKLEVDIDTKNATRAIQNIRKELESLAKVKFDLDNVGTGSFGSKSNSSVNKMKKEAKEAYSELLDLQMNIKNGFDTISILDPKKDKKDIAEIRSELNSLMSEYNELYAESSKILSKPQKAALNKNFDAEISGVKQTTEAYKELEKVSREISKAEIKIASLDGIANANEIQAYENRLKSLKDTYYDLKNSLNGQLSTDQFAKLSSSIENTSKELELLDSKMSDARRNAANKIEKDLAAGNGEGGDILKSYNNLDRKFKSLTEASEASVAAMKRVTAAKEALDKTFKDNYETIGSKTEQEQAAYQNELLSKRKAFNEELKSANNIIQENINKEKDRAAAAKATTLAEKEATAQVKLRSKADTLSMRMDAWLKKNSAAAKQFGGIIANLQTQLKSCDEAKLSGIDSEFKRVQLQAEMAGKTGMSFSDRLKAQFTKLSSYFSVATIMLSSMQAIKQGFQNVLDVDTKLTELYRVTDFTSSQYSDVYDTLTVSAQKYGATLTDLISQTADWSRAGFNDPDTAARLSEITSVYQHIADLDANTSMENLLTAYKGFEPQLKKQFSGDAAAAAEHIADVYNEIDNNYATTAADIGEAVKRSASALSLAGNTLEETAGMVTGINEVTQDPEKAGNSLKVLSMRLRGMKGELQDLGEETDENVENLSQMQGKVLNLTHGKVNIFDNAGDFKSTYEIMQGIADIYDDLTDSDKADLLETIAGKNRANEVAALIQNWDRVAQATESAENSAGSAMAEQEKYADSLQGRLNSLTSSLQTISNSALDSGFLKGLVSGATGAINAVNKIIETIGIVPTAIGAASIAMSAFGKGIFKTVADETGKSKIELNGWVKNVWSSIKDVFSNIGIIAGDAFNSVNRHLQGGENVFNLGNSFKLDSSIVDTLNTDIDAIERFKNAIKETPKNFDFDKQVKDTFSNASKEVQNFADNNLRAMWEGFSESWDGSTEQLDTFVNKLDEAKTAFTRVQTESEQMFNSSAKTFSGLKERIAAYNNAISDGEDAQKKFSNIFKAENAQFGSYIEGLDGAQASLGGYALKVVGATVKTFALEAATMALNAAMSVGISMLVSAGVSALMSWINRADELADKVKDVTTEYNNQKKELKDTKATINEVADSYAELSKGVDTSTNENINLGTDEYQKYLDIVNQIGDTFPSLISGYDAQGNAILTCAGNVDKLTEAYNKLAKANNDKILNNADDITEDFKNKSKDIFNDDKWKKNTITGTDNRYRMYKKFKELTESKNIDKAVDGLSAAGLVGITDLLGAYGEKYDENGKETKQEFISRTIKENEDVVNEIITGTEASLKEASSGMVDIAEAALSNAFISGKYKNISSKMQDYINGITSNMDYEFFNNDRIKGSADNLEDYINDMLNTINSLDDGQQKKFEIFFDMKSKLNSGDCTVGEYVNSVNDVKNVIKNSGLDKDMQYQLQMSLGIKDDDTVKQVNDFKKKLINAGKSEDVANEIVNGLTKTELEAAVSLKLKLKDMNVNDIKKAIADEAKYLEAMDFDIDIAGETDSLDKLNSALAESKSATGLTADSIDALKSRYQGLKGAGYDAAKLFEETSNGVRLNTQEYTKLEQAYAQGKLKDATSNLKYLRDKYDELTKSIATETNAKERANLVSKQEDIRQKINDLGELAAQYEGLASKYNAWQNAESAGSDRDMYENVLKGFEEVDDELSRGWLDDASKAFIDMFSYDQLNSIDDYTNRWKTLGNTIDGTTYSVKDFFTQNKDGESTNDGVYNFLEAVDQLGQGNIKRGENGEIISFDFGVNGEDAIAKTMGISKELVQIIERAAEDAGFVINMDGTYTNFADLQKAAVESNKKINELAQSSEKLKKLGLDNYTFHFDSTDAETVFNDLNKAKEMLDTFRRDDGTIDLSPDNKGAQDALNIASTLQAAYDKLADPVYMQLDASQVDDSMKKALNLMQEYRTDQKKLNQMKLQGVDTSEVEKSMDTVVDDIYKLSDDTKTEMGIDVSVKDPEKQKANIEEQLNSGELTVDATVDLQVEANDTLNDIKLLMEHQAGLITDDQLKIGLELDTTSVDDYTKDEATKIVKFLPENTDFLDNLGLDDDKKKVVVDFVSDNADFLNGLDLKDGKKEILLKYVAENPDLLKDLDDDKKKIAIDFVVNNQDILDKLDDEKQRKVVVDFVAKNEGVLDDVKTDEEKEVVVNFIANNESVLNGLDDEKQRKVIIDFVAKNPNFFDSLGLNDDEKKVAIEFVAKNQDLLKGLGYKQKQIAVEFVAKNSDFFDKLDDDEKKIAIDFVVNNQDLLKDLSDEDKQVAIDYIVKNPDALDGLSDEEKQVKINAIVSGKEGIDQINNDIKGLSDKQIQVIAKTLGNIDVENLKSAVAGLNDKQVQAIATAMGKGDVDGLKSALDGMSDKQVQAIATALGFSDVESLKSAVAGLDGKQVQAVAQALGISDVNSLRSTVNGLDGKTVAAVANAIGAGNVTSLQGVIDSLRGKTVNVVANLIGSAASFLSGGGSKANGTAHVNGTAYVNGTTGKAFKNGNWGAKEDGAALMGELGQEIVVRNGRWFTVGDNGAEFVGYKKGDIVFNHKQSEELLRNGYVTSGGGRGRALASGTAFGNGSGGIGHANKGSAVKTNKYSSSGSKSSSNSSSNSSANKEADKFEETLDWIETALDRVERAISRLDKTATSTYKNWTKRGTALNDQISQTRREIDLQNQAYNRYIQQANSVGLDAGYAAKVRDGTIDIEKITDEDLNNKISEYKQW